MRQDVCQSFWCVEMDCTSYNTGKTFPGIAKAIASQWGAYLEDLEE